MPETTTTQPQQSTLPDSATALATIQEHTEQHSHAGAMAPFSGEGAFIAAQRMAKALASSTLVPSAYQGNIPNCLIAMELASRIRVSVLATMQNLDIIQGKPSWSAKFLIATVNASGRFTPLRYEWAGQSGKDDWACRAYASDRGTGERLDGPWITWRMATKEGWTTKKGSKWMTMPELMFSYRAAAFWTRMYCPEIGIGFHTTEEIIDTVGDTVSTTTLPTRLTPAGAKNLEGLLGIQRDAIPDVIDEDSVTEESNSSPSETTKAEPTKATFLRGLKWSQDLLAGTPLADATLDTLIEYATALQEAIDKKPKPDALPVLQPALAAAEAEITKKEAQS